MGAGFRADDLGGLQMRGASHSGGELGRECPEAQMLATGLDQTEDRGVPEPGGAPVAQHHLIAVGQGEQLGHPAPESVDYVFDG